MSDEEYNARIQSVIDGSCFQKYLDKILKQKEETLKKLTELSQTEQMLREKIAEFQSQKVS
jgi:cell shape-determining protein MreC